MEAVVIKVALASAIGSEDVDKALIPLHIVGRVTVAGVHRLGESNVHALDGDQEQGLGFPEAFGCCSEKRAAWANHVHHRPTQGKHRRLLTQQDKVVDAAHLDTFDARFAADQA